MLSAGQASPRGRCGARVSHDQREATTRWILIPVVRPGHGRPALERREIRVRGKGGKDQTVRIDHDAARRVDRYLRARKA